MKAKLIAAGVKNLREFGYPDCNETNILTDYVYATFFVRMLKDNKGYGEALDKVIDELIAQCNAVISKGCSGKGK